MDVNGIIAKEILLLVKTKKEEFNGDLKPQLILSP